MENAPIALGSASAEEAMSKLRNSLKLQTIELERFTAESEEALFSNPISIQVPKNKLGTTVKILNEADTLSLLEHSVSSSDKSKLRYLLNIPMSELSERRLDFTFSQAHKYQHVVNHLDNILTLSSNMQVNATTGKIDYTRLEDEMLIALPAKRTLSDFIKNARTHSYKKVLGVSVRATKVGGKENANS